MLVEAVQISVRVLQLGDINKVRCCKTTRNGGVTTSKRPPLARLG